MSDERNFRSHYYEKFGFRGVEEKKSIELLLKDKPLDVDKLRQFCLKFPVSWRYRFYLWKVILEVIPANQDSHTFVLKNRTEQYDHLRHALVILNRDDPQLPVQFLKMFLIEEGLLPLKEDYMFTDKHNQAFISMATAVTNLVEDHTDAYWITRQFYRFYRKHTDILNQLSDKVKDLLKKEDADQKLYNKLTTLEVWSSLPLIKWFECCYACILPDTSFQRIGDIVLGGSVMILVYVAVAIFLTLRRPLLTMHSIKEMLDYLAKIPEDSGDILTSKAIEMWEKHGHHLAKSDSPGPPNKTPGPLNRSPT